MSRRLALQVLHTAFAQQEQWNGTLRYGGGVQGFCLLFCPNNKPQQAF
jgi:hypothetical protein